MILALMVAITLATISGPLQDYMAVAEEGPCYSMYVLCSPGGTVNVRSRPSARSERTGYLLFGDMVEIVETKTTKKGTWYKARDITEYGYGWISGLYLVDDLPKTVDKDMTVTASGRVAIRDGVDGKRKAWIRPGDQVHVIAASAGWALTSKGFIAAEFLSEDGGNKP